MPVEFKLPDLGEGIHEAEIIAVKVKEGETVKEDQIIFEVETDKAVVEIPSPYGGVVTKISVAAGQIVTVGSTMIAYELGGSAAKTVAPAATKKAADNGKGHAAALSAGAPVASAQVAAAVGAAVIDRSRPVPATPATRRLARELSIDLHLVHGSGPAGRVLKEDVMACRRFSGSAHQRQCRSSTGKGRRDESRCASQSTLNGRPIRRWRTGRASDTIDSNVVGTTG